jgi:flavin reductase (DIM6/NTAB) family NADH-FMN oxidoreductase RutF
LISECPAHIECSVHQSVTAGDHTLFIGEVLTADADTRCFSGHWLKTARGVLTFQHLGGSLFIYYVEIVDVKKR